jgi:mannobiose 2-epimerase
LVGFFNAWQLTGERKFIEACVSQWDWIEDLQRDRKNGEWFSAVDPAGQPDLALPKGGNWKAPYHNARCCMEILHRLDPGKTRFRP